MALVIRFSKIGRKGEKKYRIVVKEKRSKKESKPVDTIGYYIKKDASNIVKEIDAKKLKYWISNGAKPSDSVKEII